MVAVSPRARRLVTPCSCDTAGHDAGEMRKFRRDIEADAMKADPMANPDADRGDLALSSPAGPVPDPYADAIFSAFAGNSEVGQRGDDPVFKGRDEGADIAAAPLEIEHHIGHPLPGPVIGELAAAARRKDRKALRIDEVALTALVPAV